jgi:ribonuclease E
MKDRAGVIFCKRRFIYNYLGGRGRNMIRKMLINASDPEEIRVAIVEDGVLQELDTETMAREQIKGNIYKGVVTYVHSALQAAFVDYGRNKAGFLPLSEIHPQFYSSGAKGVNGSRRRRIQELIKEGQELLVQVTKNEVGGKGASLTTYISLPGRYLVLMPGSDTTGISRKIEDEVQRLRLKDIMQQINPPPDIGFIVRTAGWDRTKSELSKDFNYLYRLWQKIWNEYQKQTAPSLIYQELEVVTRTIRDYFTPDIQEILIDNKEVYQQVKKFFRMVMPRYQRKVKLYQRKLPLFAKYNLEEQIEGIYQRKVPLKSGGSIVIDVTEALVAIDVNSGRSNQQKGIEGTAYQTNLEAAREIARQLRLRDLGGIIVIDFIDMKDRGHLLNVEKELKHAVKRDKARTHFSRISKFGLLEMSRQRLRTSIRDTHHATCNQCNGLGVIRTPEAEALAIFRRMKIRALKGDLMAIKGVFSPPITLYLLNQKGKEISSLEGEYGMKISLSSDPGMAIHQSHLEFIKKPSPQLSSLPPLAEGRKPIAELPPHQPELSEENPPPISQKEQEVPNKEKSKGSLARFWFWRSKRPD